MAVSNEWLLNWAKAQLESKGTEYVTLFECAALKITFGRDAADGMYQVEVDNIVDVALHTQDYQASFYEALRIAYWCKRLALNMEP